MKLIFISLISFCFLQVNGQRLEKVFREDLINNFKEDIGFWRHYTSEYLSKYKYPITQYKRNSDNTWNSEIIFNDKFKNQTYGQDTLPHFDIEGNIDKYILVNNEKGQFNFFAFSKNPKLKNKIGMGYTVTDFDNKKTDFIYFVDYNCWDSLKDPRKHRFIQLVSSSFDISQADSIIDIATKKEKTRIHIIEVGSYFSDSTYKLPLFADYLFGQYERDFMKINYSGVDSTYQEIDDKWGNTYMGPHLLEEYNKDMYNDEDKLHQINNRSFKSKINAIDLYFDQQKNQKRNVYPGIRKSLETSTGLFVGFGNTFLHHRTINKFSDISQILFKYLIDIYK
jgi:hypothetical protein